MMKYKLTGITPTKYTEFKESLDIEYGFCDTPFGQCLVAVCARGICHLSFVVKENKGESLALLHKQWPQSNFVENNEKLDGLLNTFLTQNEKTTVRLFVKGTPLQIAVWEQLITIPLAQTMSYSDIAQRIGKPSAVRAVATAIARNLISLFIPCHRIIAKTGAIHKYRWGQERKQAILDWEQKFSLGHYNSGIYHYGSKDITKTV